MNKQLSIKKQLKEKVVQIYEAYFQGDDPTHSNPHFWDELFLLRANITALEIQLSSLDGAQLMNYKEKINSLFHHSVAALGTDNQIRIGNALLTLCGLLRGVCKSCGSNVGFDTINILIGFDMTEAVMQNLIPQLCTFLSGDYPLSLKKLCLKFLLLLITVTDNVSENTLIEYLMLYSAFEAVVQLLADPQDRLEDGPDAVLLLTILVNYRKYESANPYIVKLSILDDELSLNGYGQIVAASLAEFNSQYTQTQYESKGGLFSSFTSFMGNMFLPVDAGHSRRIRAKDSILLSLYEVVHLNRNFITTLTHSQPDVCNINELTQSQSGDIDSMDSQSHSSTPSNLLAAFLEYSSIVMQNTRDETNASNIKLCFIILACIAEDQYANSLMHDVNMVFKVQLHKMPMRHRKVTIDKDPPSRPLACALLDLMVEFLVSHLMKNLPLEIYMRCLGVTHRVLCYQKKCRVRLQYHWRSHWAALISVLKYLHAQESSLVKHSNIFQLAHQIVTQFNLFITYGDTFLPSPTAYDELYYELIRMHQLFDNVYSMALRHSSGDSQWKESATKLANSLSNIRAIINHFTPRIETWLATNNLSTLTEDQVLEVVRQNYDSLNLKLQDNLDQHERYQEQPREAAFFTQLVRSVVADTRQNLVIAPYNPYATLPDPPP